MEIGDLTAFIQITRKDINENEDEKPEKLVIQKVKKVIEVDPLDVDGPPEGEQKQEEEAPPEEENPEGAPKFKPEAFAWTSYDGKPRNYIQILKRLNNFEKKIIESDSCREEIIKSFNEHIKKYLDKQTNRYNGLIEVIKVGTNVEDENQNEMDKICKLFREEETKVESSS